MKQHKDWNRSLPVLAICIAMLSGATGCSAVRQTITNRSMIYQGISSSALLWASVNAGLGAVANELFNRVKLSGCGDQYDCTSGQRELKAGFAEVDGRPVWKPGSLHRSRPNLIASDRPGHWFPEAGFRWASGSSNRLARPEVDNLDVQWSPGDSHPNQQLPLTAATNPKTWIPNSSYHWKDNHGVEPRFDNADGSLTVIRADPVPAPFFRARSFRLDAPNPLPSSGLLHGSSSSGPDASTSAGSSSLRFFHDSRFRQLLQ